VLERHALDPAVGFDGPFISTCSLERDARARLSASTPEEAKQQSQKNTQDDGGRQREVKGKVPTFHNDVARQPAQRDAHHHQEAEAGERKTDKDKELPHD
jgi:hypothetical protein